MIVTVVNILLSQSLFRVIPWNPAAAAAVVDFRVYPALVVAGDSP